MDPWTTKAKYIATCACGWQTIRYADPREWGLSHVSAYADARGNTRCRCGNSGFRFRLASPRRRALLGATD